MILSTADLVLAPDASIDLQVHTNCSDGTWTPEQLIDHLASEAFGLPISWGGSKRYLFGAVPVGDAFLVWSKSALP